MKGILVDSNVILDGSLDDADWEDCSESTLEELSAANRLFINPATYAEISSGFYSYRTRQDGVGDRPEKEVKVLGSAA